MILEHGFNGCDVIGEPLNDEGYCAACVLEQILDPSGPDNGRSVAVLLLTDGTVAE